MPNGEGDNGMATAKELFDAGQLQAAIDELTGEVKANPADMSRRVFFFGLLCFAGEWGCAEKQLDVLGLQEAQSELGARIMCQNIGGAATQREEVGCTCVHKRRTAH